MKNGKAIAFFSFWSAVFAVALFLLSDAGRSSAVLPGDCLSSLDVRQVVRVDIGRRIGGGDVETVSIARIDGRWRIESPISAEADETAVKRLTAAIVFAESRHGLSEADMAALGRSLRDFGLAVPRCTVTVSDGRSRDTFSVGRTVAAGDEVYVCREGSKGVFTVPVKVAEELMRPLVEFRRRRLFVFQPSEVVGFGLKHAGEPLTRLAKADGQWRISNPMDAPADRQAVESLIEGLCSARIAGYAEDDGAARGLGEDEGFAVSLRDTFGAVEKVVFGASDGADCVWALTSEGAVVRVRSDLLERCRNGRKELEDTRIFPVDASQVTSFSVSEGFPAYVVSRQSVSGPWSMVSPVDALADAKAAGDLLDRVLSLRGADLVPEGSEGALTVSVGTSATNFSARCVSGGAVVADARLADLLDKTMIRCSRERIRNIPVKTAAGDGWNAKLSADVMALVDSGIVAERVEAAVLRNEDFVRCGFNRPAYTISFELFDDASALRRMLIGAATPEGGRYATIGGLDAVFVLPAPVVSILTKPMDVPMEKAR